MTLTDYFIYTIDKRRREYNNRRYTPGIFEEENHSASARQIRNWYVGRHSELYSISDGMPSISDGIPGLTDGWRPMSISEWNEFMNDLVRSAGTRNDNDNSNYNEFREWVLRRVAP
jgi:hypothetical protein